MIKLQVRNTFVYDNRTFGQPFCIFTIITEYNDMGNLLTV